MANIKGKCSGCCILNRDCAGCARCLPRWLCANVEITPAGGSGTGTGDWSSCCGYDFRLNGNCETWSGSGSCGDPTTALDLTVTLVPDAGTGVSGCSTQVDSSLLPEPLVFDGLIPVMEFSVVTGHGDILDVRITKSNVVENPVAFEPCSPCSCATCLPEKFCVSVLGPPNPLCSCTDKKLFTWDCETRSWIGENLVCGNKEFAIQLTLLPASSGICGMQVSIGEASGTGSGTGTALDDDIVRFENALDARWIRGVPCVGDGVSNNIGQPELKPCPPETPECPDPPSQTFSTMITKTITVGFYAFTVTELACGSCDKNSNIYSPSCPECFALPGVVHMSFDTTCPPLSGFSVALTWDECESSWINANSSLPCSKFPGVVKWILAGSSGQFELSARDAFGNFTDFDFPDSANCDPFELAWTKPTLASMVMACYPTCDPSGISGHTDSLSIHITA